MLNWIKKVLGIEPKLTRETYISPKKNSSGSTSAAMNEGDFHSGPASYSPNIAYPETQYGSGFDEDAEWNEGDWR